MANKKPKKELKRKAIEETLWDSANKLRGSVEPAEYRHVVLGLIFLKFASDKFEEHRKAMLAKGQDKYIEMPDFYGQEYTNTTYKLAKMNLAIRGISGNPGEKAADTFNDDQHKDLKADFIIANPPFNQKDWCGENELLTDPCWRGYEVPPKSNANYGWILNIDFDEKMKSLQGEFSELLKAEAASKKDLLTVFKELGYEIKL